MAPKLAIDQGKIRGMHELKNAAHIPRVRVVRSFDELVHTRFADGVNALCWPRTLNGDFQQVADLLEVAPGITPLDEAILESLPVKSEGRAAIDILLADQRRLESIGLSPELDCVAGYVPDEGSGPIPTSVYSFHADSATDEADTWLCTYVGASTEGLVNEEALRRVDIPETRASLLKLFGGEDNAEFREFLNDHHYDLHYLPAPSAAPYSFGTGNLWRIAVEYPGSPVPPCIHRAPRTPPGEARRLLLIS